MRIPAEELQEVDAGGPTVRPRLRRRERERRGRGLGELVWAALG
jgi:hypothetical protein